MAKERATKQDSYGKNTGVITQIQLMNTQIAASKHTHTRTHTHTHRTDDPEKETQLPQVDFDLFFCFLFQQEDKSRASPQQEWNINLENVTTMQLLWPSSLSAAAVQTQRSFQGRRAESASKCGFILSHDSDLRFFFFPLQSCEEPNLQRKRISCQPDG